MEQVTKLITLLTIALVPVLACGQAAGDDPLLRVVELPQPVVFLAADGSPVTVPAGDYWVDAGEDTLDLAPLDGSASYTLASNREQHETALDAPIALFFSPDAQPDVCFVVLMFTDGSELSAVGSYSGIQARGVLSSAKKQAAELAAATKRAEQNVRRIAQEKAEQARRRALQASANASQAVTEAGQAIQQAIPEGQLAELIDAATTLGIQDLLTCLANAGESGQGNIGDLASKLAGNPAALVQSLQAEVEASVNARISDFSAALDRIGPNPSPAALSDAAFGMLQSIGRDRPAVGCLMAFIEPQIPLLKREIVRQSEALRTAALGSVEQRLLPKIMSRANGSIAAMALGDRNPGGIQSRGMSPELSPFAAAGSALDSWYLEGMAAGLYMQAMAPQLVAATTAINAELGQANADRSRIGLVVASTSTLAADPELQFAIGMLRYRGHMNIDSALWGGWGVGLAINNIDQLEDFSKAVVNHVVGGVCGLIPEVGAAACGVVQIVIRAVSIYVVQNRVEAFVLGTLHKLWNAAVDSLVVRYSGSGGAAPDQNPFSGPLSRLNRNDIVAAAMRDLPPGFEEALGDYSSAVRQAIE